MGQLERYGLYVLCLVIFLILGVAIWGGDPASAGTTPALENALAQRASATDGSQRAPRSADDFLHYKFKQGKDEPAGLQLTPVADHKAEKLTSNDASRGASPASGSAPPSGQHAATPSAASMQPTGGAEPQPKPPAPAGDDTWEYVVKDDDVLVEIAARELGSGQRYHEILKLNPKVQPTRMRPGTKLKMPPRQKPGSGASSGSKGSNQGTGSKDLVAKESGSGSIPPTYRVQRGDSPASISQKFYGSEKFTQQIMELNAIDDPLALKQGIEIRLPRAR